MTVDWRTGAAAGLGGLAAAEAVSAVRRAPSLLDAAGRLVVDLGPRPLIDIVVKLVGASDKPVVRGAVAGTILGAGAGTAELLRRPAGRLGLLGAATGLATWVGLRRPPRYAGQVLVSAGAGGLAAAALLAAGGIRRRDTAALAAGAGLLWWARRRMVVNEVRFDDTNRHRGGPSASTVDDAAVTPNDEFYTVDVNVGVPQIDPDRWRLRVFGAADRGVEWTLDDLYALGVEEFEAVMVCVHNQLGWDRVGNARWSGVPLPTVLDRVGVAGEATTLVTRAVDGYTISLPLDLLRHMRGYLVLGMNGAPLPARHGFPARVFVPGIYGQYTGVKWLCELELITGPYPDYWARRGWPRYPVPVRPMSRIDSPRDDSTVAGPVTVTGVAWAPPHGVVGVELAVDDEDWRPVDLAPERSPAAWRPWRCTIAVPPGEHRLRTRAVSADGTVQDAVPRPPFPSGVSGHHTVAITTRQR